MGLNKKLGPRPNRLNFWAKLVPNLYLKSIWPLLKSTPQVMRINQGLVLTDNGDLWVFFPGQWRYRDFYSDIHVQIQFQVKMYRVMSLNKKLGPRPNSLKVRLLA